MLRLVIPDTNEVVKDTLKCKILVNVKRPLIALQLVLQADKKRDKTGANSSPKEKPCIIYYQIKCQGEVPHLRGVCSKIVTQSS